jgi:hypothetical protein
MHVDLSNGSRIALLLQPVQKTEWPANHWSNERFSAKIRRAVGKFVPRSTLLARSLIE